MFTCFIFLPCPTNSKLRLPGKPLATGAEMICPTASGSPGHASGHVRRAGQVPAERRQAGAQGFIREANSLIGKSINNKPYIFAEFCGWPGLGTGFVLGRMCKDDWFGHLEISEVSARAEKVFVPLSLILAFLSTRSRAGTHQLYRMGPGAVRSP